MDIIVGGIAMLGSSLIASVVLVILLMRYYSKPGEENSDH
jgi:hypothetical protein